MKQFIFHPLSFFFSDMSHPHLMQPLSIGNVVNLGVYLYRSHLKLYFKLAVTAYLWLLVPIYGWAKFYTISGLLSRLAFKALIGHPENLKFAKQQVKRQLWNFFLTTILVTLIVIILFIVFYTLLSLVAGILYLAVALILGLSQTISVATPLNTLLFGLIIVPTAIAVYLSPFWFYSFFFITDLPLALEKSVNSFLAIKQSWQITYRYIRRILGIILVSVLVTLPLLILTWFICSLLMSFILGTFFPSILDNTENDFFVGSFLIAIVNILTGLLTMPFWQAVKAVTYYDIRCRKEGVDLKLSNYSFEQDVYV